MVLEKRVVLFGRTVREGPELEELLQTRGFYVYAVETDEELVDALSYSHPDVAVLIGSPSLPSLTRFINASRSGAQSLIVVIWPGVAVQDAVGLLDMGVDYVTASFQPD